MQNFQGFLVCSFEISTLYTSLPHYLTFQKILKRTSVLRTKLDCLYMTRINVGHARSYVNLLLSLLKTYMCNFKAWYINK